MHLDNDGWGQSNLDSVFAHETGHIFGAPDEYASEQLRVRLEGRTVLLASRTATARTATGRRSACIDEVELARDLPLHPEAPRAGARSRRRSTRPCGAGRTTASTCSAATSTSGYTDVGDGRDSGYPARIKGTGSASRRPSSRTSTLPCGGSRTGRSTSSRATSTCGSKGETSTMDAGYPKPIAGNWNGLPASFTSGIDAAFWRESNNKIYLFKGSEYVRLDTATPRWTPGYPKPIAGNWPGPPGVVHLRHRRGADAPRQPQDLLLQGTPSTCGSTGRRRSWTLATPTGSTRTGCRSRADARSSPPLRDRDSRSGGGPSGLAQRQRGVVIASARSGTTSSIWRMRHAVSCLSRPATQGTPRQTSWCVTTFRRRTTP